MFLYCIDRAANFTMTINASSVTFGLSSKKLKIMAMLEERERIVSKKANKIFTCYIHLLLQLCCLVYICLGCNAFTINFVAPFKTNSMMGETNKHVHFACIYSKLSCSRPSPQEVLQHESIIIEKSRSFSTPKKVKFD